jgi:hypothetical protein
MRGFSNLHVIDVLLRADPTKVDETALARK